MSGSDSESDAGTDQKINKFVSLIKQHPTLISKSQLPSIKKQKEASAKVIVEEWFEESGEALTEKSLLKKINNMKARIKKKTDINKTGNKRIKLLQWEKDFLDHIVGDDNPTFKQIPGAITTVSVSQQSGIERNTSMTLLPGPSPKSAESSPSIPDSNKIKRKIDQVFAKYETDETRQLSNTQLSRLVMLEQLAVLKAKRRKLEQTDSTEFGLD